MGRMGLRWSLVAFEVDCRCIERWIKSNFDTGVKSQFSNLLDSQDVLVALSPQTSREYCHLLIESTNSTAQLLVLL